MLVDIGTPSWAPWNAQEPDDINPSTGSKGSERIWSAPAPLFHPWVEGMCEQAYRHGTGPRGPTFTCFRGSWSTCQKTQLMIRTGTVISLLVKLIPSLAPPRVAYNL